MSTTEAIISIVFQTLLVSALMLLQHRKHAAFKERVHAYIRDDGFVEGEAGLIIDEAIRVSAALKMDPPDARTFAHSLIRQECFRRAIAHEELHRIYVETYGDLP